MTYKNGFDDIVGKILKVLKDKELEKSEILSESEIQHIIDERLNAFRQIEEDLDPGTYDIDVLENPRQVINKILSEYPQSWTIPEPPVLRNPDSKHEEWLKDCKNDISWNFWNRYEKYLSEKEKPLPTKAIKTIDITTDKILGFLENPKGDCEKFSTKGMVVGYVQSGKTANYVGLICKAADAGFRFIIVLTGTTSTLRSQTQQRIEEGFIGKDRSKNNIKVGVGEDHTFKCRSVHCFTRRTRIDEKSDEGDFTEDKGDAEYFSGEDPVCIIIKKNAQILGEVLKFIKSIENTVDINAVPLLIIDDEADNASINTSNKKSEDNTKQRAEDITAINKGIRSILAKFKKNAYVAYTATPYANIFINPENNTVDDERDLFPSDFITPLPEPDGYFGSKQFISDKAKFPGIITVSQKDCRCFPKKPRGKKIPVPKPTKENIPESLWEALYSFILSCCIRRIRSVGGPSKRVDNAMMIHFTYNKGPQNDYCKLITEVFEDMKGRINGNIDSECEKLKSFWEGKYSATSERIRKEYPEDKNCFEVSWNEIESVLPSLMDSVEIRAINSDSENKTGKLDYENEKYSETGLNVIVIGGNSISRGLTLEGLTVSYFLRDAGSYDTLLQMGRWFGYRGGYIDLCRIYTTDKILEKFSVVCKADEDLRQQIQDMNEHDEAPKTYGLKVLETLKRFRPTSPSKSGDGKKETESENYSGDRVLIKKFSLNDSDLELNYNQISEFIESLGDGEKLPDSHPSAGYRWKNIPADKILELIDRYKYVSASESIRRSLLGYINSRKNAGELTTWTVGLISLKDRNKMKKILKLGKYEISVMERGSNNNADPEIFEPGKKGEWTSPSDEGFDLDGISGDIERDECRRRRSSEKGLLLIAPMFPKEKELQLPVIGLALSFPYSRTESEEKTYYVNPVWQKTHQSE